MINPRDPDYSRTPATGEGYGYAPQSHTVPPEISVVTPYYNVGKIFRETATSFLRQSMQNWEWLIINDCSSDAEALKVLDEYRDIDPRIRVIDLPENKGLSGARNVGYAMAKSDLVFQLDGDDLLEPTALEKFTWFLRTNPEYSMVHSYCIGFENEEYLWNRGFHNGPAVLKENALVPLVLVRKGAFEAAGGYDESNRGGLEDWEFWIAAANEGHWGATIPEYLSWYRRKPAHGDRWSNWDGGERQRVFHDRMRRTYTRAFGGQFPQITPQHCMPFDSVADAVPMSNTLEKKRPRVLLVLPWLRMGGADKWNLDAVKQFRKNGWDVSIVTTLRGEQSWLSEFARHTPDIFVMDRFVRDPDAPLFLRYMIESRKPDVVMISNSWHAYHFMPYLRAMCPEPVYVDYHHMEEEWWHNGGHPRRGAGTQDQLDLNIVSSEHLKNWMVSRGACADRIEVAYTNADPELWKSDATIRASVREEYSLEEDEPVILFAGRICAQKQPRVLAETLKRLADEGHRFRAIIAGDGEDGPWLRSFVDEHKLSSHVILLGEVPSERVRELMSAADIYFLPSQWEGIAISVYEAMSMGLAVVGAVVGGQAELVTPDVGILLPKADEATEVVAYADAIGSLLANPDQIKKLGEAARDRIVEKHTLDAMGDRMIALFERAKTLAQEEPRQRLTPGLAQELAVQAVEFFRLQRVGDEMWNNREQSAKERSRLSAELHRLRNGTASPPSAQAALVELAEIESSIAWRAVQGVKRTPVYSIVGRARYGPQWSLVDPNENPEARLNRIKNSNAYRFINKVKRTRVYKIYGKRKQHSTMA